MWASRHWLGFESCSEMLSAEWGGVGWGRVGWSWVELGGVEWGGVGWGRVGWSWVG